jgi:probable phosphoglycerate mutase
VRYNQVFPYFCAQNTSKLVTKKIYLIRHGQTDFNMAGIVQGSGVDSQLNEFGKSQAIAFFEAHKDIRFDRVYTSALRRTRESVDAFIIGGLPVESLAGLNEINWGNKEGQKVSIKDDQRYFEMLERWRNGETSLRIEGGESPDDVLNRLIPTWDYIMNKSDEKQILVCAHGRVMRVLLCHLLNYPLYSMDLFEHSNLCLYELTYTGKMFRIERFNNTDHLRSLS